jgi:hypothetical protein
MGKAVGLQLTPVGGIFWQSRIVPLAKHVFWMTYCLTMVMKMKGLWDLVMLPQNKSVKQSSGTSCIRDLMGECEAH